MAYQNIKTGSSFHFFCPAFRYKGLQPDCPLSLHPLLKYTQSQDIVLCLRDIIQKQLYLYIHADPYSCYTILQRMAVHIDI